MGGNQVMAAAATVEAPPASTAAGKTPLALGYTMPGELQLQSRSHVCGRPVCLIFISVGTEGHGIYTDEALSTKLTRDMSGTQGIHTYT